MSDRVSDHAQQDGGGSRAQAKDLPTPDTVLDWNDALHRVEGDRDFLGQLILVVLKQLPKQIDSIRQSLVDSDCATIREMGHSMKGTAAAISATRISELGATIEALGRARQTEGVQEALAELGPQVEALQAVADSV